jgi:hypothetical protein
MGTALNVARANTNAIENQDWGQLYDMLAEDFVFVNPNALMPEMNRDEWVGMSQILANAFSDLTYNFELLEEKGPQVWVGVQFEGTFDGDLDLSPLGMGVISPTGKHARAERSTSVGTINDDGSVASIEIVDEPQGAGLLGLLAKVGVNMG